MNLIRKILNQLLNILAGGSFFAMVLLTCWQVLTRYVFKRPSSWSEELVSYLFAWMTLLGSSLVVGERGHMNIPLLMDRVNFQSKKLLAIFSEVVACLFAGIILVFGGIQITSLAMGQMTSSLGIPIGFFYIVLPLSGILNIFYTILNIADILKNRITTETVNESVRAAAKAGKEA
ncbi:MAG: TRAP transporter small permease [Lachnospiraceae bacterium]|jgi:TRAP-type C4-dicarboxylate transport system permease small subunit|nr:TRAP transporter small permease [Lachnospiraceae bacterium]